MKKNIFTPIKEALKVFKEGGFVAVTDGENRENETDLIIAAEKITQEKMTFLLQHTSGLVCLPSTEEKLKSLGLTFMVPENKEKFKASFMTSIDAFEGTTTGISVEDRTLTAKLFSNPSSRSEDFCKPGHMFPLQAREGGVLKRAGHTEAAVDLAILCDFEPCSVLCEIVNSDYTLKKGNDVFEFCSKYNIPLISILDLVSYRRKTEVLVKNISSARMPTIFGEFNVFAFESILDSIQHIAFVKGNVAGEKNVLVRVHSECITGDIFGSCRCDCGTQLYSSLEKIAKEEKGVLVYLRGQEGRGIGLGHKLKAYNLQDKGLDTVDANLELGLPIDSREYGIGAQILASLGLSSIKLLTNNPEKYYGIRGFGLEIVERVPIPVTFNEENLRYLKTKNSRLGHWLDIV